MEFPLKRIVSRARVNEGKYLSGVRGVGGAAQEIAVRS